jgi:chitinase
MGIVGALVSSRPTLYVWACASLLAACASKSAPPVAPAAPEPASETAPSASAREYKVIGYFTNWVENRKGCEFRTTDVDPTAFTHINFAFAEVNPGPGGKVNPNFGIAPFGKEAKLRDPGRDGLYAQLNSLKAKNPKLKTLLSVGGWSHTDPPMAWLFTSMAETRLSRAQFVDNALTYVRDNGFDGIDIDWEYPADPTRGGRAADTKNFTSLMKELREAITSDASKTQRPALLLTVATPAGKQAELFELGEVAKQVDWINLMTYDFAGSWEPTTGINAPNMKGGPGVQAAIANYLLSGVPRDKLVLGMPTYGHTFAGVETDKPRAPHKGKGPKARCTGEEGSIAYFEVAELLKSGELKRYWDDDTLTPYAYDAKTKMWVTYDDQESFRKKLDVLQENKLAGAMFWAIDLDDYKGGYPLISTVKERLLKK